MRKLLMAATMILTMLTSNVVMANEDSCAGLTGMDLITCAVTRGNVKSVSAPLSVEQCSAPTEPCPYAELVSCHMDPECWADGQNRAKVAMLAACMQVREAIGNACQSIPSF